MRAVRFEVSAELVRRALSMPDGCRIEDVWVEPSGVIGFIVHDPSFPDVDMPVEVEPTVTERQAVWCWNLPEDVVGHPEGTNQ